MSAERRLTGAHLRVAAIGYAVVAVLVLVKTRSLPWALGVFLGPAAGGVARGWQGGSRDFSLALLPYGVLFLAVGLLVQILVAPASPGRALLRRAVWSLATAGWLTLAVVSYLQALE